MELICILKVNDIEKLIVITIVNTLGISKFNKMEKIIRLKSLKIVFIIIFNTPLAIISLTLHRNGQMSSGESWGNADDARLKCIISQQNN